MNLRSLLALASGILFAGSAEAALPASSAGALDPTFGNGGIVITNPTASVDQTWGSALQPDGKLVIAAAVQSGDKYALSVLRYLDTGSLDPSFGTGGINTLPATGNDGPGLFSVGFDGGGRIFVGGYTQPGGGKYQCAVWAFLPDGRLDTSFGSGGVYRFQFSSNSSYCQSLAVQSDGKVVLNGYDDTNPPTGFALRVNANGTLDASFNGQGWVGLPATGGFYTEGIAVAGGGSIFVAGMTNGSPRSGIVYKLRANGTPDPAFGTGGLFLGTGANGVEYYGIALLPDGRVVVAGDRGSSLTVARITAAGAIDASFGSAGYSDFIVPGNPGGFAREIFVQRDGKYVVEFRALQPGSKVRFGAARVMPAGGLDAGFGSGGIVVVPALSAGNDFITGFALGADGKLWLSGIVNPSDTDQGYAVVRLLGDEITTLVTEFYNTALNHYFITADPVEAASIDAGGSGPGWSRTGQNFKSGGPTKAGRFYGNPDINPATGLRWGPNSHVYSFDSAEIAQIRQDKGWRFESYDFNAWPKANGACPAGTQGVMRAYNNRFAQNDSNHRYAVSQATYNQMLASGWSGEGVVFCAPL
jgi:uncharacterized delta-60 repeat protein